MTVERDVPDTALYLAFHMPDRRQRGYYVCDLISDVLSNGNSSRLYQRLVKEEKLFVELDAYVSGDHDPGLFIVSGKLAEGVTIPRAKAAIWKELQHIPGDARLVHHALHHFPSNDRDVFFIENVGNLICPTTYDLGEDFKVVVLSVTEGDDGSSASPTSRRFEA